MRVGCLEGSLEKMHLALASPLEQWSREGSCKGMHMEKCTPRLSKPAATALKGFEQKSVVPADKVYWRMLVGRAALQKG